MGGRALAFFLLQDFTLLTSIYSDYITHIRSPYLIGFAKKTNNSSLNNNEPVLIEPALIIASPVADARVTN